MYTHARARYVHTQLKHAWKDAKDWGFKPVHQTVVHFYDINKYVIIEREKRFALYDAVN